MSASLEATIALSISTAPDARKLGMPEGEVKRVLLAIATAITRAGKRVLYSGHLDTQGYTSDILVHAGNAYGKSKDAPIVSLLPESELARLTFEKAVAAQRAAKGAARFLVMRGAAPVELALNGSRLIVDPDGAATRLADVKAFDAWKVPASPAETDAALLTRARALGSRESLGRVAMGGKMGLLDVKGDQYMGAMPGVAEEAILTIEAGRPLVVLGAYGGCARDIAIALGLLPEADRAPRGAQAESYAAAMIRLAGLKDRVVGDRDRLSALARSDDASWIAKAALAVMVGE